MELSQLKYFKTAARLENFSKAARTLHISQPTLSSAIAKLEEELGTELFDRYGKSVKLNPYGQVYLSRVDEVIRLLESANDGLRDMVRGQGGQIRVGASFPITQPSPVYYYQYEFFQNNPKVSLFLHVHAAALIEQMLLDRELDLGITTSPATRTGIASIPLYTDKLGIIVGKSHRLSNRESVRLEALHEEFFLCNSSGPDPNDSARHLCALAGFLPNILYEGESSDLIGEAVSAGRGISFVSKSRYEAFQRRASAPEWERELHYVALENDFCTRTVYLLEPTLVRTTAAAERFRDGLLKYQLLAQNLL